MTSYKRLDHDFVLEVLMDFYETPDVFFREYCYEKGLATKRVSLMRVGNKVNLFQAKVDKTPTSFIYKKLASHLKVRGKMEAEKMKRLHHSNKVLTDDEISLVVSSCIELSTMGLGIDEDTCLDIVNCILRQRVDDIYFTEVTKGVVQRIIKSNKKLLTLVKGNSIDPKRVRQADEDVRDALFVRVDSYVKMLHSQGKVPWKSAAEVPADRWNNMDEIATNAHDHRKKVIAAKQHLGRLYQEVNSGDNKMPFHITVCIISRGNGELFYFN